MPNDANITALGAILAVLPPVLHIEIPTGLAVLVVLAVWLWRQGPRR